MIGHTIGRYRIIEKLGEGGMGAVWKAEDSHLQRMVALKLLPDSMAESSDARRRFVREGRAASQLKHPGIATVYDAGEEDGNVFIALACIEGETIHDCVRRQPLPADEVARIGCEIADALRHAHDKGIIHRDITSRNIMLTRDRHAIVLDFGLALPEGQTRITRTGAILGTAAYLSPEVINGGDADCRSDLYGLGVVMYEMLTGSLPFTSTRPEALLMAILYDKPRLPSERRAGIPERLEAIVLKTLEKVPEMRYQSAAELLAELRTLEPGSVASAPRRLAEMSPIYRADSEEPTRLAEEILSTLPQEKLLAVAPFKDTGSVDAPSESAEAFAHGFAETVSVTLANVPHLLVIPPSAHPRGATDTDPSRIARSLGANLLLNGSVRRSGDRIRVTYSLVNLRDGIQLTGEQLDGSVSDLFEIEDRLAESVFRSLRVEIGDLGSAFERAPRHDVAAHEHYLQAIGYLQRYDSPPSVDGAISLLTKLISSEGNSALYHAALGRGYLFKYQTTLQGIWEERASAACHRALELDPLSCDVLVTLGNLHHAVGRYQDAVGDFERALVIRENNPDAIMGIADARRMMGDFASAETAYRRVVKLRPEFWGVYNNLGLLYFHADCYERAAEMWRRVVELTPDNHRGFGNLGSAYFRLGRFRESIEAYRQSNDIQPNASALSSLGTVHFFLGNYDEAALMFERGARLRPDDARVWGNLGDAYRWIPGRGENSRQAFDRAIRLMQEQLLINPNQGENRAWLADWLAKRARAREAIEAIEKAMTSSGSDTTCMVRAVTVYHILGRTEAALEWLERAVQNGYGVAELERDPELAELRQNPRFGEIVLSGKGEGTDGGRNRGNLSVGG